MLTLRHCDIDVVAMAALVDAICRVSRDEVYTLQAGLP